MAMISSIWHTLVGDKQRGTKKEVRLDSSIHERNLNHLEKRKLVATRVRLEEQTPNKLDLDHLRARIDRQSHCYGAMRERQQKSHSRWFGERSSVIDEAALAKRLAFPTAKISEVELELNHNYGEIHWPDHYDLALTDSFAVASAEEMAVVEYVEAHEEQVDCIVDTADFSDLAQELAEVSLLPPLEALSDNIPELNDLLARLQIVESLEAQEEAQAEVAEAKLALGHSGPDRHADLHIVTPFDVCLSSPANSPVPMIKPHGKSKKGKRARSKEAAKMKNGTRN